MVKVLFVCLGNICRSPMAEAIFQHLVNEKGLEDDVVVDSAGTGNYHVGEGPHEGTVQKLKELDISTSGLVARQVSKEDFIYFDYIIVMDDDNIDALKHIQTEEHDVIIKKLMDFVPDAKVHNVPDPYFTGDFDETYELVSEACQYLLNEVRAKVDTEQEGF